MATSFKAQVRGWAELARVRAETFATLLIQDLGEVVIERTPVDTGFLRSSWYSVIGQPSEGPEGEVTGQDGSGEALASQVANSKIARVANKVDSSQLRGQVIWILNNAEYAPHVEFGTQNREPESMVRRTVRDAPQIASDIASKLGAR